MAEVPNVFDPQTGWMDQLREQLGPESAYDEADVRFHAADVRAAVDENERLRELLKPFARLAITAMVQSAMAQERLLTLSDGRRMCGVDAKAIIAAAEALEGAMPSGHHPAPSKKNLEVRSVALPAEHEDLRQALTALHEVGIGLEAIFAMPFWSPEPGPYLLAAAQRICAATARYRTVPLVGDTNEAAVDA
jgi:hypothetical protein